MALAWRRVAVAGTSMAPTLADGDWLLLRKVRGGDQIHVGEVVLIQRPDRPGLLLIKRAVRRTAGGWWVAGDNAAASDDSRTFGAVPDQLVLARAVLRYHPAPRLLRRT